MKMRMMKSCLAALLAAATVVCSAGVSAQAVAMNPGENVEIITQASTSSVSITNASGYLEGAFAEWSAVSGAEGYNVYADGTKIDSMLIRQYASCFRADAVGLKAGSHTLKIVPIISGKEDTSKAAETKVTTVAHDRSGFGWVNGTSSGAYNEDGTLRDGAVVLYITEDTKDTVTMDVVTNNKGATTTGTGIQEILNLYKKGYEDRPLAIRVVGTVTDPKVTEDGDLVVSGSGDTKRIGGITLEGIGTDAVFYGFGIRLKNVSNMEIRNMAVMLVDSGEGDNYSLQQSCDHIWVHHCDSFYGMAGGDSDQAKGDGALDCKKSTYITFSYNHFWDNGKCNLLGLSENTKEDLYITYHHNWYDHSDSRHPRVRFYSAHVYNNYYDGNAKYGIGSTQGSSIFAENNYFRNCKYPMLISMQGSDIAEGEANGTFSKEDGGIIKAYGNIMEGQKAFIPYSEDNTNFDAYVVSSKDEKVPSSVVSRQTSKGYGGTYNNFDTSSVMYSYKADDAKDVPAIVTANAGRLQGGDFQYKFDNSVADTDYSVDADLMAKLKAYKSSVISIGSGFTDSTEPAQTTESKATTAETKTTTAESKATTESKTTTAQQVTPSYEEVIYASPDGKGKGTSASDPTDVLNAIKSVKAGGCIYLLEGTYKLSETIKIDESNSGSAGKYKTISAYNGAKVIFDFSGQAVADSNRGVTLDGDYWHFYGFTIKNAGDNGMLLSGNHNIIEMMIFENNQDTGLQISRLNSSAATIADWPSYNLVKNCTARNNCDDATMENADGFAAKLTCGEGNVFDGCFSYNNSDDGWDLYAKPATGPIGVVTLKNCIAFRNGFTEDGRGYGDCDGNGFKLGGGEVGTRHIVENCLAFENLNCGFTDNNNPEFGEMRNSTAYNNNLGGGDKANLKIYRNSPTAIFENILSYTSTANVSKTNAAGIKAANDKLVGALTNGLYYNGKYYYTKSKVQMENGSKLGDVVTPADSDFVSLKVDAMGADFHTLWRNADGSPNPKGFAETPSNGTYASLGYHMMSGVKQESTPGTGNTSPGETQSTTKEPVSTTAPQSSGTTASIVEGSMIHNFTENGTSSSFYTITGNMNSKDISVSYNGLTLKKSLKMESATAVTFTASAAGTLTLVTDTASKSIKVNGTKYTTDANGVATVSVKAGAVEITKGDSMNLAYIAYAPSGSGEAQTTTTTITTTEPSTGTLKLGDVTGDGVVDILDVIEVNKAILGKTKLTEEQNKAADVNGSGAPDAGDSLMMLKYIVDLIKF